MNNYDAQEILRLHNLGRPVAYGSYDEAKAYLSPQHARPEKPKPMERVARQLLERPAVIDPAQLRPPMAALCECGTKYGQHRVNDFRCRNPDWTPGNGQAQWLPAVFRRAR